MARFTKVLVALFLIAIFFVYVVSVITIEKHISNFGDTKTKVDTAYSIKFDSTPIRLDNSDLTNLTETIYYPKFKNITVDTGAIISSYLSCKASVYNYRKDSLYNLVIADSICLGKLVSRTIDFKNLKPDSQIFITTTITKYERESPRSKLCLGVQSSAQNPLAPSVLFVRNKIGVGASYGVYTQQASIGLYYQIK